MNRTQNSFSQSPMRRGNATFMGPGGMQRNIGNDAAGLPMESPRNLRYESKGQFDKYSKAIDNRLIELRRIMEVSATSKASQARNQAMQAISEQIHQHVPNVFSHTNRRYEQVV